jgi:hypothetical protein
VKGNVAAFFKEKEKNSCFFLLEFLTHNKISRKSKQKQN